MAERGVTRTSQDPSTKELNDFVQNLLKQMQQRFETMSGNIIGRIDEMGMHQLSIGKRIDDIQKSIGEIMNDVGEEETNNK